MRKKGKFNANVAMYMKELNTQIEFLVKNAKLDNINGQILKYTVNNISIHLTPNFYLP